MVFLKQILLLPQDYVFDDVGVVQDLVERHFLQKSRLTDGLRRQFEILLDRSNKFFGEDPRSLFCP